MQIIAAGGTAKIVIVILAVLVVAAFIVWKVVAVSKAAKTQGSPEEKHKAVGEALHGKSYGKGYDVGRQAGEKTGAWLKKKLGK